jgi:hypothetical protein
MFVYLSYGFHSEMAKTHRVSPPSSNDPGFHQLIKKVKALLGRQGSKARVAALMTLAARLVNKRSHGAADDDRSFASDGHVRKRPKLSIEPLSAPAPAWASFGISPSPTQLAFVSKALMLQEANTPPSENTRSKRHL